jgi:hypothetical protein
MRRHPIHADIYIDDHGVVFRALPTWVDENGYNLVHVGKTRIRRHTLVCETFHSERPAAGLHVRHLNGDPGDDVPGNLAWGTPTENGGDTIAHGRTTRGVKNARAILTLQQAQEAWDRRQNGESALSIGQDLGVSAACIHDITKGNTWPEIRRG